MVMEPKMAVTKSVALMTISVRVFQASGVAKSPVIIRIMCARSFVQGPINNRFRDLSPEFR